MSRNTAVPYMDSMLHVPSSYIDFDYLDSVLRISNPEYENALKHSKWGEPKTIPKELFFYREEGDYVVLPRRYSGSIPRFKVDLPTGAQMSSGSKTSIVPRGYQKTFLDDVYENLEYRFELDSPTDVIFEVPCGHGKTIMALHYASRIGQKVIVFCPTNGLVKQWKSRIESFTNWKAGILDSSPKKISLLENIDIVLTTLDMFNSVINKYAEVFYTHVHVGLAIFDEAHRMGARTYHPILEELKVRHRLALTATLRRPDGMAEILKQHFNGHHFRLENQYPDALFYPWLTEFEIPNIIKLPKTPKLADRLMRKMEEAQTVDPRGEYWVAGDYLAHTFRKPKFMSTEDNRTLAEVVFQKTPFASYDTFLSDDEGRLKNAKEIIRTCIDSGRTLLVLSKRKAVLKKLFDEFKEQAPCTLIISETAALSPEQEHEMQNVSRIIFGINQLAAEGLDIDRLDTLLLLQPIKDTEQAIGRILRYVPGKKRPLAFYPLDNFRPYRKMYEEALNFVEINATVKPAVTLTKLKDVLLHE